MLKCILPLFAACVLAAPVLSNGKNKGVVDSLQGVWTIDYVETNGKLDVRETAKRGTLIFQKGQCIFMEKAGGPQETIPYRIDVSKQPIAIDFRFSKDFPTRGIVLVQKDQLVLCVSKFSDERPTEFSSRKPGHILVVLSRVK
jgi:uncharacterized protein (TIGR03067 family)